jgi:hypothetical protein
VKTVVQRVETWMSNKGKSTPFVDETQEVLSGIEDLNLSWCKVQPFTGGKFGGWVSENFLGLSRLLKWLYSRLDEVASDKEPFVQPDLPLKKWLAPSLKGWLKARKLPHEGLKAYNMGVITEYYRCMAEEGQPLPDIPDEPAGPVQDVLSTLESLDDLVALLMVESIEDESYYISVEQSIRVFLTHFADMDEKLKRKSESVSWLSSYNFLSLLNLPDIIREYGPLRLIWEGGSMGEGFLRFVKPNINQGLRKGWEPWHPSCGMNLGPPAVLRGACTRNITMYTTKRLQPCPPCCRKLADQSVPLDMRMGGTESLLLTSKKRSSFH